MERESRMEIQSDAASSEPQCDHPMIERVARALAGEWMIPQWDDLPDYQRVVWRGMAEVAIGAMREPTEEMLDAAMIEKERVAEQFPATVDESAGAPSGADYWRVMQVAALGKAER